MVDWHFKKKPIEKKSACANWKMANRRTGISFPISVPYWQQLMCMLSWHTLCLIDFKFKAVQRGILQSIACCINHAMQRWSIYFYCNTSKITSIMPEVQKECRKAFSCHISSNAELPHSQFVERLTPGCHMTGCVLHTAVSQHVASADTSHGVIFCDIATKSSTTFTIYNLSDYILSSGVKMIFCYIFAAFEIIPGYSSL